VHKFITLYLKLLPFLGLLAIVFGALRAAQESSTITVYLLVISAFLDLVIVILGRKFIKTPLIVFVSLLLLISVFVGLFNGNELSRRYITDFTNPLFFFCKILIFKEYWKHADLIKYFKFYSKIAFCGSIILLPIAYFIYSSAGVNRIAIFPPLELPFASYLQGSPFLLIITVLLILLYGKRAQLGAALGTFLLFVFIFKRKQFVKYVLISLVILFVGNIFIKQFSDNSAVSRVTNTVTQIFESDDKAESLSAASAGRDDEIETVLNLMNDLDYFWGKGIGFTYDLEVYENDDVSNVHFSPLAFLSKYGLLFTILIYWFFIKQFFSFSKFYLTKEYIAAYATVLFVFLESFFAYALFVTPILPVVMGYIYNYQQGEIK
jgi:hypothetical protein